MPKERQHIGIKSKRISEQTGNGMLRNPFKMYAHNDDNEDNRLVYSVPPPASISLIFCPKFSV